MYGLVSFWGKTSSLLLDGSVIWINFQPMQDYQGINPLHVFMAPGKYIRIPSEKGHQGFFDFQRQLRSDPDFCLYIFDFKFFYVLNWLP
jgi:hypothetical protein